MKPLKESQTKVLVIEESRNTQPSDFDIRYARVRQEALPQLNDGRVINHFSRFEQADPAEVTGSADDPP